MKPPFAQDADLLLLALLCHEPYFTVMRENMERGVSLRQGASRWYRTISHANCFGPSCVLQCYEEVMLCQGAGCIYFWVVLCSANRIVRWLR